MTMPTESRDEQWLRALEARRAALDSRVPAADEALYAELQQRLDRERGRHLAGAGWKRTLGFALAAFTLGVVVARFAVLSSAPAVQSMAPPAPEGSRLTQDASRSPFASRVGVPGTPIKETSSVSSGAAPVTHSEPLPVERRIKVPDPLATVEKASRDALHLGMTVSMTKEGAAYRLYMHGLETVITPEEQRLRESLFLPRAEQDTARSILVRVEKREDVRPDSWDALKREQAGVR